ncbi:hypothetical protein SOVF_196790 [Spinacia oleracea]|nr:hypothetical protein SOVF_196790 [Spinacia oleracea]
MFSSSRVRMCTIPCLILFDLHQPSSSVLLLLVILDVFRFPELLGNDAKPYTFSYAELRLATGDFDPSNKLGEGGFTIQKITFNQRIFI